MKQISMPVLPKELKEKSNFELVRLFVPIAVKFVIFGYISQLLFKLFQASENVAFLTLIICAIIVTTCLGGLAFTEFTALAHDGGHGLLHKSLNQSFFWGIFCSSFVPGFLGAAYNETHFEHHKYVNTDNDPDALWFRNSPIAKFPRPIALFVFGLATKYYFSQKTLIYVLGKSKVPNLSLTASRLFSLLNIALNLLATILWVSLLKIGTSYFVLWFLIPWMWTNFFDSYYVFTVHSGTFLGFKISRSLPHPLFEFLFDRDNFHLEHHLYPYVQRSKLGKLHSYLRSVDFFKTNGCMVDVRFWRVLSLAFVGQQPLFSKSTTEKPIKIA